MKDNLEHVIGYLDYNVNVTCPYCNRYINLVDLETDGNDLGKAVFGGVISPAQWENVDIEFSCPECEKDFRLVKIEY